MIPIMFIFDPPTSQKKPPPRIQKYSNENRERGIQLLPLALESKRMIVAPLSKENHHRTFIVMKGPPPEFNPHNCAKALDHIAGGVLAWISDPWYFL
jgi:hypothetical protein